MPLIDPEETARLLSLAKIHRPCNECGQWAAQDYCRSCDAVFWHHKPGCAMFDAERNGHAGHRCVLVPFVEDRSR